MSSRSVQAPSAVVMIRPHRFQPNPQTKVDNAFQAEDLTRTPEQIADDAYGEVTAVADSLSSLGVGVHLFEDESGVGPDTVFPNNWFSTHAGGHVALYPMYSPNRRRERRSDVIEMLKHSYRVQDVIDYSGLESDNIFLEGTGAMVLDHLEHVAYAARSNRTNEVALERFCTHFRYEPMLFEAVDPAGRPIYHTNVLMCIGTEFAMVGLSCITDSKRRDEVADRLREGGKSVVDLSMDQIANFAGNAIELSGSDGKRYVAISRRALDVLREDQREVVQASATFLPLDIATIELAGGSVRCMLAGVHLARRPT